MTSSCRVGSMLRTFNCIERNSKHLARGWGPRTMCRNYSTASHSVESTHGSGEKPCEDIKIPVPWGHIAGKWWGRKDVVPVLGLHGMEDNAGSFDRLAPLLDVPGFLAWDAPGHGLSSHFPSGINYHFMDFIVCLRRIVKHFGWNQVTIIGHSFGSAMGLLYSALYPNEVKSFISLDCARVVMALEGQQGLERLRMIIEKSTKADARRLGDPPAYEYDKLVDAFCNSALNSVSKKYAHHILNRGVSRHPKVENAFYFSRDPKLGVRVGDFNRPNIELQIECAKSMKAPTLAIFGKQGFALSIPAVLDYYLKQEAILQKSLPSFERHELPGTHHVHLNNAELVAPIINKFINSLE